MGNKTPLHGEHEAAGAKLVDFAGWDMPINYGSQIAEHNNVRDWAGMFDVSHMRPIDIQGAGARDMLRHVFANDVDKIAEIGRAFYTCMLNEQGGIKDDLIVYHLDDDCYRVIANAAIADKDIAWLEQQAGAFEVTINARHDLAIIAVQGPEARRLTGEVLDSDLANAAMQLKPFRVTQADGWAVGRTGYTGEDGFEIMLPDDSAIATWQALQKQGVKPTGLGARDTLRLEAGLNLYGQDMNEQITPFESGLGWTVDGRDEARHFIGREALEAQRQRDDLKTLVGLVLKGRGMIRPGMAVRRAGEEQAIGEITSGSFAPTLQRSIALARVPKDCAGSVELAMRRQWVTARVVSYPFVRNGKVRVDLDS